MSTPLAHHLRRRIALEGPISVADYMAAILNHPEHGYYMRGDPFGRGGDFITAPEISQMFGEILGLWCAACWQQMGRPNGVRLIELGPGRGTLMADALRATRRVADFHAAMSCHLIETSPALTHVQHDTLARVAPDIAVRWHTQFADVPEGPVLLLANEFFDALPIHQFQRTDTGWRERRIDVGDTGFIFVLAAHSSPMEAFLPPASRNAPLGAIAEICPTAIGIVEAVGRRIATAGGAGLIIDYGSTRSGPGDSFQAVRRHRSQHVLANPGSADLTAHVDFESLSRSAAEAGARCYGPIAQSTLLRRLGIEARAVTLATNATATMAREIATACQRLIDDKQMGTLFKALALVHPALAVPAGFEEDHG